MATDRLRTSPLDTEHLDEQTMLPARVRELMASGHTVDVVDWHLVVNDKPDDDSSGYIVTEIETTVSPDADAERITLFVCHCAHAHHRVFNWERVDGPEGADPSDDKHVERVLRSEKRARDVDDDQDTLLSDGGCPIPMCPACETRMVTPPGGPRGSLERAASWECPSCGRQPVPDGGRSKCVECGGWLPEEIDPGTGVYCPKCGTGQLVEEARR